MDMKSARKLKRGDEVLRKSDNAKLTVVSVIDNRGLTINRVAVEVRDENDLLLTLKHTEIK